MKQKKKKINSVVVRAMVCSHRPLSSAYHSPKWENPWVAPRASNMGLSLVLGINHLQFDLTSTFHCFVVHAGRADSESSSVVDKADRFRREKKSRGH